MANATEEPSNLEAISATGKIETVETTVDLLQSKPPVQKQANKGTRWPYCLILVHAREV